MSDIVLAIDVGTSSSRTALFSLRGERIPNTFAQRSYTLDATVPGQAELRPSALRKAISECLEETLIALRNEGANDHIVACGVSTFWHSLIGLDSRDTPTTEFLTWADSRCEADAADLRKRLNENKIHSRTGCMLRASFWPAKLKWIAREQPTTFDHVRLWLSPGEWLQRWFCGPAHASVSMVSATGLWNPTTLKWDDALLAECAISESQISPVSDEPLPIGGEIAEKYPELRNVPFYPAIGDGAAGNLGSGATRAGWAAINVGTSAAVRVVQSDSSKAVPFGLFRYRIDADRALAGGAVSNAGNLRAWCLRELKIPLTGEALEAELAARRTPNHGLRVLPFWVAERAPTWRADSTGAIVGFQAGTTATDILQATTEAVFYRIARIANMLGEKNLQFIVAGGIQHSSSAMQRLANILDSPVFAAREPEASLRGAAVFALEKINAKISSDNTGKIFEPEPEAVDVYREERRLHEEFERKLYP
ncbi:MAG TPA: FGGY family carbohydrate kinase [Chthoniobacterales bacterium]